MELVTVPVIVPWLAMVALIFGIGPPPPAGLVAVMDVGELTVNPVAGDVPKLTAVAPVKFVPVIVTGVPPVVAPEVGLTAVTVGADVV